MDGTAVPEGWLVTPHDGVGLTAADVIDIVNRGIAKANRTRAAIRLPLDSRTRMVFAVTDTTGEVLGLFRMPDATIFSIDVAVAKARNVAYYADPAQLQAIDQIPGLPAGVAFTNRTFRYVALPYFPEGQDNFPPGPFSILNDGGTSPHARSTPARRCRPRPSRASRATTRSTPRPTSATRPTSSTRTAIVFFPGSVPLYKDIDGDGVRDLVGGLGVSGDGVDQDDVVTFFAAQGFEPPANVLRADQVFVRGVRLPYQKFNRNPFG